MPLASGKKKSAENSNKDHHESNDSQNDARNIGTAVAPQACCKSSQAKQGETSQPQLHCENDLIDIEIEPETSTSLCSVCQAEASRINDAKKLSHIEPENYFITPQNVQKQTLNSCCQSEFIHEQQNAEENRSSKLNQRTFSTDEDLTSNYSQKKFERELHDTPTRRSDNSPREHILDMSKSPSSTNSINLMDPSTTSRHPSNRSDTSNKYTDGNAGKNIYENGNKKRNSCCKKSHLSRSNREGQNSSRELKTTRNSAMNHFSTSNSKKSKKDFQTEPVDYTKPLLFSSPMHSESLAEETYENINRSPSKNLKPGGRQGIGCCRKVISGLDYDFQTMADNDINPKKSKTVKNTKCACTSTGDIHKMDSFECKKKTCKRDVGTSSCVSVTCVANEDTKCHCRYPPFYKQFSCAGNITGSCNCNN